MFTLCTFSLLAVDLEVAPLGFLTHATLGTQFHTDGRKTLFIDFSRVKMSSTNPHTIDQSNIHWSIACSIFDGCVYLSLCSLNPCLYKDLHDLRKHMERGNENGSLLEDKSGIKLYTSQTQYIKDAGLDLRQETVLSSNRFFLDERRTGANHQVSSFISWIKRLMTKLNKKHNASDNAIDLWCRAYKGEDFALYDWTKNTFCQYFQITWYFITSQTDKVKINLCILANYIYNKLLKGEDIEADKWLGLLLRGNKINDATENETTAFLNDVQEIATQICGAQLRKDVGDYFVSFFSGLYKPKPSTKS